MRCDEMAAMLAHDEDHWWYRGRRRVLLAELERLPLAPGARLLDAGCGSGRTLDLLARFGVASGVDLSSVAVAAARRRGHPDVEQAPVESLPFDDATFDIVTCLDVIEHTPDDQATLSELCRVTRPGGLLLVTVPAYPSLWSHHDEVNLHFRRYGRGQLRSVATASGWTVVRDTHFNALLLAPAAAVRKLSACRDDGTVRSDLDATPAAADRLLELPLAAEARLLRRGGRLAAGLSILMVLRRDVRPPPRAGIPAAAHRGLIEPA